MVGDFCNRHFVKKLKITRVINLAIAICHKVGIYEQPGDEYCPLRAYELYISLINADVDFLWQKPNANFRKTGNWYHRQVVGKHVQRCWGCN